MGTAPKATRERIWREANRMLAMEKFTDFVNQPRQFFHRRRVGYYSDRLVQIHRWLINDEQQQVDEFYGYRSEKSRKR